MKSNSDTKKNSWLTQAICATIGLTILSILYSIASRGFDYTDEGFYLNTIHAPWEHPAIIPLTLFGYPYHLLYKITGQSVANLRIANTIIMTGASAFAGIQCLKGQIRQGHSKKLSLESELGYGLLLGTLVITNISILTPNYNSLCITGLLIVTGGVAMHSNKHSQKSLLTIGFGSLLVGFGKPSSSVALFLLIAIYTCATNDKLYTKLRLIFSNLTGSIAALFMYIGIQGVAENGKLNLMNSLDFLNEMESGHGSSELITRTFTVLTIDWISNPRYLTTSAALSLIALFLAKHSARKKIGSHINHNKSAGITLLLIICVAIFTHWQYPYITNTISKESLFAISTVPIIAFTLLIGEKLRSEGGSKLILKPSEDTQWVCLSIFIFCLSFVYIFGSNGDWQTRMSKDGSIFWSFSFIVLVRNGLKIDILKTMILVIAISIYPVLTTINRRLINKPYRQANSILEKKEIMSFMEGGDLKVSKEDKQFVNNITESLKQNGFYSKSNGIVDLTGQMPTLIYLVGGIPLGNSWLVGGYPGSENTASLMLNLEKNLSDAWIFVEENGPRSIKLNRSILKEKIGDISKNYELVAEKKIPDGAGGYEKRGTLKIFMPR